MISALAIFFGGGGGGKIFFYNSTNKIVVTCHMSCVRCQGDETKEPKIWEIKFEEKRQK